MSYYKFFMVYKHTISRAYLVVKLKGYLTVQFSKRGMEVLIFILPERDYNLIY